MRCTTDRESREREREREEVRLRVTNLRLQVAPFWGFSFFASISRSYTDMRRTWSQLLLAASHLLSYILLFHGVFSSNVVTLESILIYTTHDWLPLQPSVYFRCQGEEKKKLPDVKETNFFYTFKGEESWQPLTELPEKKCKRCGFYEEDRIGPDDVFDEWELCPSDFNDGKYMRFKAKEFNATFMCPSCTGFNQTSSSTEGHTGKKINMILVVVVGIVSFIIVVVGSVAGFKYWQKRKREQDQARFRQLFQEVDEMEDEIEMANAA